MFDSRHSRSTLVLLGASLATAFPASAAALLAMGPPAESTANEILLEAATVQGRPAARNSPEDRLSLYVAMGIQYREDGNDVLLEVERRFQDPGRLWTRLEESVSRTVTYSGFDGKTAWYQREEEVTLLEGADYGEDRRKLQRDLDETRLYARIFLLHNLRAELRNLERLPDETNGEITAYVIEGRGDLQEGDGMVPVTMRLWIDKTTQWLWGVRVARPEEKPLNLCFDLHERGKDGVLTPGVIRIYVGDDERGQEERNRSPRAADQEIYLRKIDFRPEFTVTDFQPPLSGNRRE